MNWTLKIALAGLSFLLLQCAHKEDKPDSAKALVNWHSDMHALSDSLSKLLPLAASPRAFNDPKNDDAINGEVKKLMKISHAVDSTTSKPNSDPGMAYMAQRFSGNMEEALRQLNQGNRVYARRLIQQSTAYCISCHTRTDQGRSNLQLSAFADTEKMSKMEQADFLIAVRDYDKALNKFDQLINSSDAQIQSPQTVEIAAEKALAIAVRVKRDPFLADELLGRIVEARWAPVYLRLNALAWKQSVQQWKKGPSEEKMTLAQKIDLAKNLTNQGWKMSFTPQREQAGLVHFLRASSILHEVLGQAQKGVGRGEAYYYAGLAAEGLKNINLWTLQDTYYEACIRQSPRTAVAKKCFLRYEAIQMANYTSMEGVYIPLDVRERLLELKNLSEDREDNLNFWEMMGE